MDKSVKNAKASFFAMWDPMILLMSRARAVEFKIRVSAEFIAHQSFHRAKKFEDFMKGPRRSQRKKVDKHIRELFGKDQQKIVLIRECADALAHADYITARRKVLTYRGKYGLQTELSEKRAGILLIENVRHDDGKLKDIGYLLDSSEDNLIIEEFEVFDRQGYKQASEEMLSTAEEKLLELVPNLPVAYTSMVGHRALKYGDRREAK